MTATIIEIALSVLILIAILKEDKLKAWEDRTKEKVLDFLAWCCAQVIVARRKIRKAACSFRPKTLQATNKTTTYSGQFDSITAAAICQTKE